MSEADLLHSLFCLACRDLRGKIAPERPKLFGKPERDLVSTARQLVDLNEGRSLVDLQTRKLTHASLKAFVKLMPAKMLSKAT